MRSVPVVILHASIMVAAAKELAAKHKDIERSLIDHAKTKIMDANLDATTFAKPQAGTNARSLATMNRLVMPNRRTFRASANVQPAEIAMRYGKGIYELATEKNELESVKAGMESLKLTLAEVPDLGKVLSDPMTSPDKKKGLIDKVIEKGSIHTLCNYLVDKTRVDLLPNIIDSFDTLYNAQTNVEVCTVQSACPLEEDQLFSIAQHVQKATGAKSVKIQQEIDENLIGGFVLSYGGLVTDLSVRSSLNGLRKSLMSASYGR